MLTHHHSEWMCATPRLVGVTNHWTTNHWTGLDWNPRICFYALWYAIAMNNYLWTSA